MKIALVGTPNSGKTTIFNKLTGSHQKVGNWAGVTVDAVIGTTKIDNQNIKIYDLPGVYSLTPFSPDEAIVRDILIKEKFDKIVAVIDVNNIGRNLYPVIQLLEMQIAPVILVLNMWDEFEKNGYTLNINLLEKALPIKIIPTIGTQGKGIDKLKEALLKHNKIEPFHIHLSHHLNEFVDSLITTYPELSRLEQFSPRWIVENFLRGDYYLTQKVNKLPFAKEIENKIIDFEKKYHMNISERIFEDKYGFINGLIKEALQKKHQNTNSAIEFSDRIDKVINIPIIGIPLFLLIMLIIFILVFKIGSPIQGLIEDFFEWLKLHLTTLLINHHSAKWVISLINDGIISGIGNVIIFLPNILILFFSLSFLEDIGYMSRAAFVMDRFMHKIGLHGKSFIPLILGFGCNVPAIMSTRILESKKDRIITILINPFMSCSARLTIYILFTGIFFKKYQGLIVFSIYLVGIILAIISAALLKHIFFKREESYLIIELPPFRKPILKNSLTEMWLKSKEFLAKAGTIIFASVIIVWILSNIPFGVEYASKESLVGKIGSFIAPIFKPAGFGYWQIAVALFFGFVAKEQVVGILGTLFASVGILHNVLPQYFTPLSAYSFMIFTLIYTPCLATIAVMKREIGWKWTMFSIVYSISIAWILSTLIYQIGQIF